MSTLNLIVLLEIYLILSFAASFLQRGGYYVKVFFFVSKFPSRWPRTLELAKKHKRLFLTWRTVLPVVLTLLLMLVHLVAYRFIWPQAEITPADVARFWPSLLFVTFFGGMMLVLDLGALYSRTDWWDSAQEQMMRDLDRAEWLLKQKWLDILPRITRGRLSVQGVVSTEIKKALHASVDDVNQMMWLWSLQITMRLAFGLALWLTWAFAIR